MNRFIKTCVATVLTVLLATVQGFSGEVIVGTGTTANNTFPYNNFYRYATTQSIYTASEIGVAAKITSIAYEVAASSSLAEQSIKIYMAHTSMNSFSSVSSALSEDELTEVYSGTITLGSKTGWESIKLTTPFVYNGSDNLVVVVTRSGNYVSSLKYKCTTVSNMSLYRQSDDFNTYADISSGVAYTASTTRPNIKFISSYSLPLTDGYYLINTVTDLETFRNSVSNGGLNFVNARLMNDLTLNERVLDANGRLRADYETVGLKTIPALNYGSAEYTGVFDGNNHTISGIYCKATYYVGLFADLGTGAVVKDLKIRDSYFEAQATVAAIAGTCWSNNATIQNCSVQAHIYSSTNGAGGILGAAFRNGTIDGCENLGIVEGNGSNIGGMVGRADGSSGKIINCSNSGTIIGSGSVGGIVGEGYCGVTNCNNTGTVSANVSNAGGIVGHIQGTLANALTGNYNTGRVESVTNVGGIIGLTDYKTSVEQCYNAGPISGTDYIGGLIGNSKASTTIANVYNTGSVAATEGFVGGLVGSTSSSITASTSFNAGVVTNNGQTAYTGALCGSISTGTFTNCYYLEQGIGAVNNAAQSGCTVKTKENFKLILNLSGFSTDYWKNTTSSGAVTISNDGEFRNDRSGYYVSLKNVGTAQPCPISYYNFGTTDSPDWQIYTPIYTYNDLANMALTGRYVLMNDLRKSDGSSVAWNPIGTELAPFTGTLIGRGKTIAFLTNTTAKYNGILGYTNGATIKNVTIAKSTFTGAQYVGAIVAYATNTLISGCTIDTCTIQSSKIAGGLCGYARADVRILDCRNYGGSVSASEQGGGIIGYCISSVGQIERCLNTAMITADIAGGIIGKGIHDSNRVKIRELVNYGSITASTAAGGVVGEVSALGYVYDCINYGNVNNPSSGSAGGIIGKESSGDYAYYCINIGTITGKGVVGAICGAAGSFTSTNCYYNKDISGAKEVAGTNRNNDAPKSTVELGSGELPSSNFDTDIWGTRMPEIKDDGFKYKYYPYLKWLGEEYIEIAQKLQCFPVTMNYIGGTADEDLTFYVETEGATLPSDVTQLGFTFGGWYSNSNYAGSPITEITVDETGPKTYYAKWSVNNYSVTLNTDGGIINRGNITSYNYGFSGTLPTDVTKTGYTFAGWYEVPRADLVLSATNITGNISNALLIEKALVNASGNGVEYWREKILSLVNNTETEIIVAANADATTLNKYLKELAKTSAVYSIDYDIDALPKTGCDLILESYNESALSATVAAIRGINGCSLVEARDLVLNSPSTIIDNVSLEDIMAYKAQLEAVGATVSYINYDEVESLVSTDYGDRCYKAKWNVNTYNVVLEANGGKNENVINEYTYGIGATLPDDSEITRTGYTFGGWYLNSSFTGDMFTEISDSDYGDKIYYAKWTAKEYDVSFNANNGVINGGDFDSYTFGTYNLLPTDVTRTGYTFGGWYEVKEGEAAGASVTDVFLQSFGAAKLAVLKVVKNYTGLGLAEAKTLIEQAPVVVAEGMDVVTATTFVQEILAAGGAAVLQNQSNGVATRAIAITDYGNKEFEAKWLVNTYTVTLQANGGTINSGNVTEYVYGALKSLPTNVTRTGYTFAGWYANPNLDGNKYVAISSAETGDKTFYAKWNVNSYAVTLDANGGSINSGNISSYTYGVGAILPTDVTKIGFTFNGWIDDETAALATNIANNAVEAKYYTASWSQIDYTITYNANGGTSISSDTYHYEDEVTLPEPTRTGYNFLGWYNNSNLVGTAITTIEDTEYGNKEFWAKWEANTYTVTLNANSGEINSGNIASYTYDVLAILPQDVTKTGNTFGGWFDNEACTGTSVTQIVKGSTGNKTYYAKWTPKTYTVTLQTNNGTINAGNIVSYTYNVGATLPTDVTKNGYEFVGWFDNSSYEGGVVTEIAATEVGDRNFWAKWKNASYAVALNANGGSINSNNIDSYVYGAGVVLPTDVTKTGYRFLGWKDSENNDALAISATDFGNKAFTAQWAKATYTITYDANGGDIDDTYEVSYQLGDAITLPTTVTKVGNTFVAWYDNVNLIGEPVTELAATEVGDKSYFAKWQANTYTVTLDAQEGAINTGNVTAYTYGVTTSLPTNVTREGYTFTGWYTNAECTGDVASIISSTTAGDQTYYAGWSNTAYAVTLNTNNGVISAGSVISYTHGTAVQLPTTAQIEKTGYTFAGWYDNSSCTGTAQTSIAATATGDKAFWAKWTVNTYDITLNSNEGTINSGNVTKYTYGVGATLPTDITKTGCTFAGWYTTATFTGESVDRIDEYALDAKTFYAKWTENDYSIVYETSGGAIENVGYATNYTFGTGATLPNTVSKTGYTFAGWFTNSAYEGVAVEEITATEYGKKTYYAKWNVNSYAVTFNSNDGTINSGEINSYSYGVGATLPTNVTKSGYTFAGWYNNEELAGAEVKTIATNAYGEKNFWAKWVINTYTITLNANGGVINAGSVSDYEFATGATLPTNVTRDGYEFAGWYNNSNLTGERIVAVGTDETGNKSYYAKWNVNSYAVTLNTNGGTVNSGNVVAYTYSNGATLPIDVTRTGYKFAGWYANAEFTGEAALIIGLDEIGDKAYYAKWTPNTYAVELVVNDGTIVSGNVTEYTYGVQKALPTDVTREGYEFAGWYNNSNYDNKVVSIASTDFGNKTYYAKWNVNSYAVTLNVNEGTINSGNVASYVYGNGAILPSDVTKVGNTFGGWYTKSDFSDSQVVSIDESATGDKVFYAKWTPNTYTVTLVVNDGTINSGNVSTYKYGEGAVLPTDVTKVGYEFAGWYNNSNYDVKVASIAANDFGVKTFYAKWTVKSYAVKLNSNDGVINANNVESYTFGEGAILPTNVTRVGYEFAGWYDNVALTGSAVVEITTATSGDKEFWAKWTNANYAIAFDNNGGNINDAEYAKAYTFGTSVALPSDITREGYTFAGWYDNVNLVGKSVAKVETTDFGNKTFYAKWNVNSYTITLNANDGTINSGNVSFYIYGNGAILPSDVTKTGNTFGGWYTKSDFSDSQVVSIDESSTGNKVFYAKWTPNTYAVELVVNEGTINASNVTGYTFGVGAALPTDVTKQGHDFAGWYNNSNYDVKIASIAATDFGNKTFYAKWNVNSYIVTLNANEGTINSGNVTNYVYGNGATLPSDVTKTGYKFDGWYNVTDSTKQVVRIDESSTGDQAFFAKWTANSYNVILVVNEGTINEGNVESYVYGEGATLPSDVTKEGYTFEGWFANTSYTGGSVSSIAKNDVGDKQFWAKWSINEYVVNAVAENGTVEGTGSYEYKSTATLKATANDGYEFVNWSNGSTDNKIQIVVTKDTTVTANFKEKEKVAVVGTLTIPTMKTEREAAPIDLTGLFTTTEGSEVICTASSSRPDVVAVSVVEGKLLFAVSALEGEAEITVTATLPNGEKNSVSATASVVLACNIQVAETIKNVSCYGESDAKIALNIKNAAQPYTTQWMGETATTDTIENVKAGNYTVAIVDAEGCEATKTFTVTEPDEMTMMASLKQPTCENADGAITVETTGVKYASFAWSNGATTQNISKVAKGDYKLTITNTETGCSISDTYTLTEPEAPVITVANVVATACNEANGAVTISVSEDGLIYNWSNNKQTKNLMGVRAGDYTLEVVNPETNCKASLAVTVPSIALKQPEIALVTVSQETGKNLVVWLKENTDLIDYYTVYRETDAKDVYEELDQVPYSELSVYEDLEADPNIRAWRYKITATDVCGVETEMSAHHKTMHITKNMGMNNSYNLIWDEYEGLDFSSFIVYRKYKVGTKDMMDTITTLPSNVTSYTDENPVKRTTGYCVAIVLPEEINPKTQFMKAESGPFSLALSNIAEAENEEIDDPTGLEEVENAVVVYAIGHTIYVKNAEGNDITIYDNNGRVITNRNGESDMNVSFEVRLDGTYFVKVGNESFAVIVK